MLAILLVGQLLMSLKAFSLVEVEPSIYTITRTEASSLPPLKERTMGWGFTAGFGVGSYQPTNYSPSFSSENFDVVYGKAMMMDVQLQLKKNFRTMSFAADLGAGFYSGSSKISGTNSDVQFNPIRLGATVILDGLFKIPYVAPYGSLGAYTTYYKETKAAISYGGNTQAAIYYGLGALFLMDWMDQKAADRAYSEASLQATYLYVEARQYMKSSKDTDPDLSTGLNPSAGIRLEF